MASIPDVRDITSRNSTPMKPGFRTLALSGHYRITIPDEATRKTLASFENAIRENITAHAAYGAALGHLGQPVYAQVQLQDKRKTREFWQQMSLESSAVELRAFLKAYPQLPPARWVYAPVSIIRSGFFIASLISRPWMRNALFVALYGFRNPIDCASCTETFFRTVDEHQEHIRFPFWACVSLKGFASGRCANCLWRQDKGTNPCSFRLHPERIPENALYEASPYLLAGSKASTWIIDPGRIPRAPDPLTPSTCPIDPMPLWHGEDLARIPFVCPGLALQEHFSSDGKSSRNDDIADGPPSPLPPKKRKKVAHLKT